jgi:hypothetical protein
MGHNAKMKNLMNHAYKDYFVMFIELATKVVIHIFFRNILYKKQVCV